jgi:Cft2 family RNA processing exonuclease
VVELTDDLKLRGSNLYLDSRQDREICFVSHAHSDHIACHGCAIATPATAALLSHRIPQTGITPVPFDSDHALDGDLRIRLLPAGHVLGSAMLHVTRPEGTLLYTGDFKLGESLTVEQARPEPADTLVMESTFGLPFFRFPPRQDVIDRLIDIITAAFRDGRQPIVLGYSLGKAQEATRILTAAGFNVTLHGAPHGLSGIYNELGVDLGPYRRYRYEDFHGKDAIDLDERGVLVAPPHVARSAFVTRFKNPCRIILTGWALLKNAIYRYGVDHALPLSDHADFGELLETVERVNPKKIFTVHGYEEFATHLRDRGYDATALRHHAQLTLFGE